MIMPPATSSQTVVSENKTSQPSISSNNATSNMPTSPTDSKKCAGCGSPILDRYYYSALDRHWHGSCLKCSQCKIDLESERSCFTRDGLIFCKTDYYRLFSMRRCSRCGEGIYASELVMRVRDQNVYHIQCFTCAWCNVTLSPGDLFGLRDSLVYCRLHYEMLCTSSSAFPGSNSILTLGPPAPSEASHHQHPHPHHHHHHHHSSNSSPMHEPISADTCSSLAATPYVTGGGGGIFSPLTINGLTTTSVGSNGQSPTTPQSIRKGRPRKRKNADPPTDSIMNSGSCTHESLSPSTTRSAQSPSVGGSLDGGPLSGLAASIENSCLANSQLSNSALSLGHQSGQRTKRMRTSFKHHQLRTMKTYFSVNQNPDAKDLKQLAQKTGLSKRVLQVWFQNARAKWRRNNLKMLPESQELSLNGQTNLLSLGHPSTPSTVIGSPNGSTRPFSSPSPAMSPVGDNGSLIHQPTIGPPHSSASSLHSQTSGLDTYGPGRADQGLQLQLNFQELY